eukprot:scaffold58216_cov63-Phaeocystis_antarctica.AAC.1
MQPPRHWRLVAVATDGHVFACPFGFRRARSCSRPIDFASWWRLCLRGEFRSGPCGRLDLDLFPAPRSHRSGVGSKNGRTEA